MKVTDYLISQFLALQKRKFYGTMRIEFKEGVLVLIRFEETKLPPKDLE